LGRWEIADGRWCVREREGERERKLGSGPQLGLGRPMERSELLVRRIRSGDRAFFAKATKARDHRPYRVSSYEEKTNPLPVKEGGWLERVRVYDFRLRRRRPMRARKPRPRSAAEEGSGMVDKDTPRKAVLAAAVASKVGVVVLKAAL